MKKSLLLLILGIMLRLNGGELCVYSDLSPDQYGKIVIITGISSCGKTSVSNAVQKFFAEQNIPYAIIHGDEFYEMLPSKWVSFSDPNLVVPGGSRYITRLDEKGQTHIIHERGEVYNRMGAALGNTIAVMAFNGINVIYEEVLHEQHVMNETVFNLFKNFSPYFIYVDCPLEFAQENERKRHGIIGLAATQKSEVIFPRYLDMQVLNGPGVSVDSLAQEIVNFVNTYPPRAFKKLQEDFEKEKSKSYQ